MHRCVSVSLRILGMVPPPAEVASKGSYFPVPVFVASACEKTLGCVEIGNSPSVFIQLLIELALAPTAIADKKADAPLCRVAGVDVVGHGVEIASYI